MKFCIPIFFLLMAAGCTSPSIKSQPDRHLAAAEAPTVADIFDEGICVIPDNAPENFKGPVVLVEINKFGLQGSIGYAFYWHGPVMAPSKADPAMYGVLAKTQQLTKSTTNGMVLYSSGSGFTLSLPLSKSLQSIHEGQISIDMNGWILNQKVKDVLPISSCRFQAGS